MRRYTTYYILGTVILLLLTLSGCSKRAPVKVNINAKCAMIMDAGSGNVLYEKNADMRFPPASTAKVMTAVIAVEKMPLNSVITPSSEDIKVEPTIAGLKAGVGYTLNDLLSAMLIKSGNDAAKVIACAVSGNENDFAVLMNEKARNLGMEDANFANASGLPTGKKDGQYITARDLAVLMRYALRYPILFNKMALCKKSIYGDDDRKIVLRTHNKTLLRFDDAPVGKTGYTIEAKRTFVGVDSTDEPHIIISLLQSDRLWKDIMELDEKGLIFYKEHHRTVFSDIIKWIKSQRKQGCVAVNGT